MAQTPLNGLQQDYATIESDYRRKVALTGARPAVERAFYGAWFAVDAVLLLFFAATVLWYAANGMFVDERMASGIGYNMASMQAKLHGNAPAPIIMGTVDALASGTGGKYDVFIALENPNDRHGVEIRYKFLYDGGETDEATTFVNPGSKKTLVALGAASERPRNPHLEIVKEEWVILDPHDVPSVGAWLDERNNFPLADVAYAHDLTFAEGTVSRSSFTITNETPYSYWNPTFLVKLLRGSNVISLTTVTLPEFESGETRAVDVRWYGDLPSTATVAVEPDIAFFDPDEYMDPQGRQGIDVRNLFRVER